MKNLKLRILFTLIKIFQNILPKLAGYLSSILWFSPLGKGASAIAVKLAETSERILIEGITVHSWGSQTSKPTIILVHGWGGRWDQFGNMIPFLVQNGYRVITFDLPAHGETKGFSTSIPEWLPFFRKLSQNLDSRPIYICHSFGLMAISYAYRHDHLPAAAIIAINLPSNFHFLIEQFANKLKLNQRTIKFLMQYIKKRVGARVEEDVTVPFRKLKDQIPLFMIADQNDREVPYSHHAETLEVLKDRFVTTQNLGHSRILQDPENLKNILRILASMN